MFILYAIQKRMATSQQKSKVAQIRIITGETADDFADIIGKSLSTLRSLETGRLKLSEETALKISQETGVNVRWLMTENSNEPPVGRDRKPYTIESYHEYRVGLRNGIQEDGAEISDEDLAMLFHRLLEIYASARAQKQAGIFVFKLGKATYSLLEEYMFANITNDPTAHEIVKTLQGLLAYTQREICTIDRKSIELSGILETSEMIVSLPVSSSSFKPTPQKKRPSRKPKHSA